MAENQRGRRAREFKAGDYVRVDLRGLGRGVSLYEERFAGPFEVIAKEAPNAYRIRLPEDWNVHDVLNVEKLKPAHPPGQGRWTGLSRGSANGKTPEQVSQRTGEATNEFEVERIDGHRWVRRGPRGWELRLLVKWRGHGEAERTELSRKYLDGTEDETFLRYAREHGLLLEGE